MAQRCLGQQCNRGFERRKRLHLSKGLHAVDRFGRHRHGAHRLLVALVADIDDLVTLAGKHLDLVVHLGDQRAHCIHHQAATGTGLNHDLRRRAVSRQHDGGALGHLGHVIDEDHTLLLEALHHAGVVHDLVVAVHGSLMGTDQPGQRLDGHLHTCAEAARRGQQHRLHALDRADRRCHLGYGFGVLGYGGAHAVQGNDSYDG